MKKLILTLAAGLFAIAASQAAPPHPGTTPISAPTVIAVPGTYQVTQDLTGSLAITIQSSNVILDLGGHTIHSGGYKGAIVVRYNNNNITIKNGILDGGGGIDLFMGIGWNSPDTTEGCTGCVVENVTFTNYAIGIFDTAGKGNRYYHCVFLLPSVQPGSYGIQLYYATAEMIDNNQFQIAPFGTSTVSPVTIQGTIDGDTVANNTTFQ
jgi:hypothetical protein